MRGNFEPALEAVLKHEGGFVNHPRDPGGMTNLGVTKRVWEEWVGRQVTEEEMRALTPEAVEPLYRARYWDAVRGDDLPAGVDYAVFDCAVNSGPRRAIIFAQRVASVTQDGVLGPKTLAAIEAYCKKEGADTFVEVYSEEREAFLRRLPTFAVFGRGWTRRVADVEMYASRMVEKGMA